MFDPDAGRLLDSDLNAILTRLTFSDVVQYAQRTPAECLQFLCAGPAGFPEILQTFRANVAQNLRDLDAGLASYVSLKRTSARKRN